MSCGKTDKEEFGFLTRMQTCKSESAWSVIWYRRAQSASTNITEHACIAPAIWEAHRNREF
ncbi:Hypothetical protein PHPALM_11461 [Phytophthora palmivora]|uniref:Uncharacterized protein n=1 Tax=Phytophthora palmivora TaxID=4796 RepID=A0A2P4Y289_9STRA|nr:Hypothetical protein PHPALM_11461 [Phytophthora palmivora]